MFQCLYFYFCKKAGRKRKDEMGGDGREYVRGEGNVKELKWINEKKSIFSLVVEKQKK